MRGRDLVEFQATYFYASFVPRPSPFVLCILQAIKNWMVGRPGNKGTSMLSLATGIATPGHVWPYWSQNECTVENQVSHTLAASWKSIHIHRVIWGVSDRTHSHYSFLQPQWLFTLLLSPAETYCMCTHYPRWNCHRITTERTWEACKFKHGETCIQLPSHCIPLLSILYTKVLKSLCTDAVPNHILHLIHTTVFVDGREANQPDQTGTAPP